MVTLVENRISLSHAFDSIEAEVQDPSPLRPKIDSPAFYNSASFIESSRM